MPLVTGSVWLAMVLYGAALIATIAIPYASPGRSFVRILWTAAVIAMVGHAAAAMHVAHGWSHARAVEHTAKRTAELLGWEVGWGVYANYLVLLVWSVDAAAAWRRRVSEPPPRWSQAVHVFVGFMIFQGAVVFATGPSRWLGLAIFVAAALAATFRRLTH